MDMFRIIGVGFVTAVASLVLKTTKPELSFAVTVTGVLVILFFVVDAFGETFSVLRSVSETTGLNGELVKTMLKAVGIGYLTEFGAGILSEFGAPSVADKVSLAGKLAVVLVALPVIEAALSLFVSFLRLI